MYKASHATALIPLLLIGCGHKESETTSVATADDPKPYSGFDYTCTDGLKFNAKIDRGDVVLTIDGKSLTLPADKTASGAHYTAEGVTFIATGKDATLIRNGESPRTCSTP